MSTPPPQGQNPYGQQPAAPYGQPQDGNPYGQQQPGPYGQPGVPQQPSPYFNQGGPVPPAPVAPSGGNGKKIFKIVAVVAVIVLGIGGYLASRNDADTAKVGDCMSIGDPNNTKNPDLEVVDCSNSKAKFKVAQKKDGTGSVCDLTKYSQYNETGGSKDFTLCLSDYKK